VLIEVTEDDSSPFVKDDPSNEFPLVDDDDESLLLDEYGINEDTVTVPSGLTSA